MFTKPICGVYGIFNIDVPGRVYVGGSGNVIARVWAEICALRNGKIVSKEWQSDWDAGNEFRFVLLEKTSLSRLAASEIKWIKKFPLIYNKVVVGKIPGVPHTPDTRSKMSTAQTLRFSSRDERVKISVAKKGEKLSEATRAKMSASMKQRWLAPEQRKKMSFGVGMRGVMKGKKHSLETRAKMSASAKIRWAPPETRAQMSAAHKGKAPSAETRAKLSVAAKHRYASPEERIRMATRIKLACTSPKFRAKMSAIAKLRWSKKTIPIS